MPRLFVGIELPDDVKDWLLDLQDMDLAGVRWSHYDQFHLTLRFIGDVHDGVAREILPALAEIEAPGFELGLCGCDAFGSKKQTRVLWAGVTESQPLRQLQRKIERRLVDIGLEPETRKYRPHVTLARGKSLTAADAAPYLARHAGLVGPRFSVSEFTLFSSQLGRHGAHYEIEARYPLDEN